MQDRKFLNSMAVAFAMMAGLASCSNEELNNQLPEGPLSIKLVSSVGSRAISQDIQSTQIASGVQVGVFVTSQDGSNVMYGNQGLQADGDGGFTAEHDMTFPEDGGSVNIYAYAPYNSSWNDLSSNSFEFTVPTEQITENEYCNADLMIGAPASNPVASTAENVPLVFKHMLTKLNLHFDTSDTQISLKGAKVYVCVPCSTVSVNIKNGTVTTNGAQTQADALQQIEVADFTNVASNYTASAIFVPQTITSDQVFVKVELSGNTTVYDAKLSENKTFEGGKKYTYTVKFSQTSSGGGEGEGDTELTLIPGLTTSVEDWGDGDLLYGIGDYVTKNGNFVKKADAGTYSSTDDPIKAVIFSTTVSDKDKADYNAYAMGLELVGSKTWINSTDVIVESITDYSQASQDLDGLTKTISIIDQESDLVVNGTIFEYRIRENQKNPVGTVGSDWFVPSFGQMLQILENLGGAEISESEVTSSNFSCMYSNQSADVINAINKYIAEAGYANKINTDYMGYYATVTESGDKYWCLQTKPVDGKMWGFGKHLGKVSNKGTTCTLIPCVAIKIPASSASTLQ